MSARPMMDDPSVGMAEITDKFTQISSSIRDSQYEIEKLDQKEPVSKYLVERIVSCQLAQNETMVELVKLIQTISFDTAVISDSVIKDTGTAASSSNTHASPQPLGSLSNTRVPTGSTGLAGTNAKALSTTEIMSTLYGPLFTTSRSAKATAMDRFEASGLEFNLCQRCYRRQILRPIEDQNSYICSRCSDLEKSTDNDAGIISLTIETLIVGLRHYLEEFRDREFYALRLIRERDNFDDSNAIEVFALDENLGEPYIKIGYICQEHARVLAEYCFPILGTIYEYSWHLEIEAGIYEVPLTLTFDLLHSIATDVRHDIIDANGRAVIRRV